MFLQLQMLHTGEIQSSLLDLTTFLFPYGVAFFSDVILRKQGDD
jgi:hypothetical protein